MNGLALTILVGQLPKLFGFKTDGDNFIDDVHGFVQGRLRRQDRRRGAGGRRRLARHDPRPADGRSAGARRARRGGGVDRSRSSVFSLADHGVSVVGSLPSGFPPLTIPDVGFGDLSAARRRRRRDRGRVARGHDLDRLGVRRPDRRRGGRQPRDDRHRRRKRRRRPVPGLPGLDERIANGRR